MLIRLLLTTRSFVSTTANATMLTHSRLYPFLPFLPDRNRKQPKTSKRHAWEGFINTSIKVFLS